MGRVPVRDGARVTARRCAVCNVDEHQHEPCSTCFVAGAGVEPLFVRRARGIALCGRCYAEHKELGISWSDHELVTGELEDVAGDERRSPLPLRDAMRPDRPRGRPRDPAIDERVLPEFHDRAGVELAVRKARPRRTWRADERGRYRCSRCERTGHNQRSCGDKGFSRRRRRRRGTYVRETMTSRRQIAARATCGHTSVDRRFDDFLVQISLAR
jgi:hypothetical protein